MESVAKWAAGHADLVVALSISLVALVLALLGVILTLWIKPKLKILDDLVLKAERLESKENAALLTVQVATLDTKMSAIPDLAALHSRVDRIESAREVERLERQRRDDEIQKIVRDAIERMQLLHERSEKEILRMLDLKDDSWAIEQAGQDVMLAESAEHVARLAGTDIHNIALARLKKARSRFDDLNSPK